MKNLLNILFVPRYQVVALHRGAFALHGLGLGCHLAKVLAHLNIDFFGCHLEPTPVRL